MRTSVIVAAIFMAACMPFSVARAGDDLASRLDRLAAEIAHQAEIIREQQKAIQSLKEELARHHSRRKPQRRRPR
jgi:septal ring factor EnvC (AmiA/AmiB activator)